MNNDRNMCVLNDIYIYQGDTKDLEVYVFDESNNKVALDTVIVKFILCEIDDETIVYLEKNGTNVDSENVSKIKLSSSDTIDISMNKYTYKIEIQYNTGDKNIGKGYFIVM